MNNTFSKLYKLHTPTDLHACLKKLEQIPLFKYQYIVYTYTPSPSKKIPRLDFLPLFMSINLLIHCIYHFLEWN